MSHALLTLLMTMRERFRDDLAPQLISIHVSNQLNEWINALFMMLSCILVCLAFIGLKITQFIAAGSSPIASQNVKIVIDSDLRKRAKNELIETSKSYSFFLLRWRTMESALFFINQRVTFPRTCMFRAFFMDERQGKSNFLEGKLFQYKMKLKISYVDETFIRNAIIHTCYSLLLLIKIQESRRWSKMKTSYLAVKLGWRVEAIKNSDENNRPISHNNRVLMLRRHRNEAI